MLLDREKAKGRTTQSDSSDPQRNQDLKVKISDVHGFFWSSNALIGPMHEICMALCKPGKIQIQPVADSE